MDKEWRRARTDSIKALNRIYKEIPIRRECLALSRLLASSYCNIITSVKFIFLNIFIAGTNFLQMRDIAKYQQTLEILSSSDNPIERRDKN